MAASIRTSRRPARKPTGVARDDSDDELGVEDLPWKWLYDRATTKSPDTHKESDTPRKRKRTVSGPRIVGAGLGTFQCFVGDCVLLKAEGSKEAWVAIICEFVEDDEGEKAANFMWFSTEKEIRNKERKRLDFLPVCCLFSVCQHRGLLSLE